MTRVSEQGVTFGRMPDDPYVLLGVTRRATRDEIAEAYRALAQIYHPDRYAEASPRVQAEAAKRMQALNGAYEQLRRVAQRGPRDVPDAARSTPPSAPAQPPPPARQVAFVHYVDGAKGYHNGDVVPLGFAKVGSQTQQVPGAQRCSKLDSELRAWFDLQRSNASLSAKQMYQAWNTEDQEMYAATVGCSQVPRDKARSLGVPCGQCRP